MESGNAPRTLLLTSPAGQLPHTSPRSLRTHFETRRPPRWAWKKDAPHRDPPSRFVYFLDHQYSQRGLSWHRLKGDDAPRARVLRAAAARAECEVVLSVAEIQETWSCFEEDGSDLHDLQDSSVALTHWLEQDASALRAVSVLLQLELDF